MRKYGKYERMPDGTRAKQPPAKSMLLQTYFTSLLCMVLCVTMFFGTSYAWFSSEVNNAGNEIYVGILDVELKKQVKSGDELTFVSLSAVDSNGKNIYNLFDSQIRWEPGYTALETLQVVNRGHLAFDFELKFISEDAELNKDLASMFEVYVCNATNKAITVSNMEAIKQNKEDWAYVGDLDEILSGKISVFKGSMSEVGEVTDPTTGNKKWNENGTQTYIIALHMKESATVTVNQQNIMGRSLKLNVKLIAYQKTLDTEKDGFGNNNYDAVKFVTNEADLRTAVENATNATTIALSNDIQLTQTLNISAGKDITLDLNGHTISGTGEIINNGALTVNGNSESAVTKIYLSNGATVKVKEGVTASVDLVGDGTMFEVDVDGYTVYSFANASN